MSSRMTTLSGRSGPVTDVTILREVPVPEGFHGVCLDGDVDHERVLTEFLYH